MTEDSNRFFEDISDDCFIECDELLAVIRRNLLKLDEMADSEETSKPIMEELLRSCHTLKGLTGMIGAEQTMQLTHSLENYLKANFEGYVILTDTVLDTLFSSVNMLEQQLSGYKKRSEIPDASAILEMVDQLLPPKELEKVLDKSTAQVLAGAQDEEKEAIKNVGRALDEGKHVWKFTFSPTRELFERGININEVRNRIQQIGRVLQASPTAGTDGKISFDFVVSTDQPEASFSALTEDGIQYAAMLQDTSPLSSPDESDPGIPPPAAKSFHDHSDKPFTQTNVIKVELSRLDDMMRMIGDLVISRARLNDHLQSIFAKTSSTESQSLQETNNLLERQLRDLREGVMRLRLVPVGDVFERMKFVLRDLIRESGKSISLEVTGQETQIDKFVVEKMLDPLLHLVRNAVSHGIETIEEREATGKPAQGKLILRAYTAGDGIIIEVEDDGHGIDRNKVEEKAIHLGLIEAGDLLDDDRLLDILSASGFSTREVTDLISGRGVGMSVVKKNISELGGAIDLTTEPGKGTTFRIALPLTLSIVDALIVKVSNQVFAVPLPVVNEVIRFQERELVKMEKNEMVSYRDSVLPVIKLCQFFHIGTNGREMYDTLVVGQGNELAGLAVDKIIGQREIVVRSLSDPFIKVEGISGATELGEGKAVLILDVPSLIRSVIRQKQSIKI